MFLGETHTLFNVGMFHGIVHLLLYLQPYSSRCVQMLFVRVCVCVCVCVTTVLQPEVCVNVM